MVIPLGRLCGECRYILRGADFSLPRPDSSGRFWRPSTQLWKTGEKRRDESRRGRQECPRHGYFTAIVTAGLIGLVWTATLMTTGTASPVAIPEGTTALIWWRRQWRAGRRWSR